MNKLTAILILLGFSLALGYFFGTLGNFIGLDYGWQLIVSLFGAAGSFLILTHPFFDWLEEKGILSD